MNRNKPDDSDRGLPPKPDDPGDPGARWRVWEFGFLAVLLLGVAASCWPWMTRLGLEYDEAHFLPAAVKIAVGSPEKIPFPSGLYLFHRPFPLMTAAYIGAFDAYLYGLVFALFGISVLAFRLTNLVLSLLLLTVTYGLARSLWDRGAAVVASLLLALDLEFLLHAPTNYGPTHVQMLCGALSVLLLYKWLNGGPQHHLAVAAFLLGLAFTEKLTFVLFVGSLLVALLGFYGRPLLARLTVRSALLATVAFVLGCLPVLISAIADPAVILEYGRASASVPSDWGALIAQRLLQFRILLDAQWTVGLIAPYPYALERLSIVWWALCAAGMSVITAHGSPSTLLAARAYCLPRVPGFLLALSLGTVVLSAFFPESGRPHHLMLTYPFVQCAVATGFLWLWQLAKRQDPRAAWAVLAVFATGILATYAWVVKDLSWYTGEAVRTGGRGAWSAKIHELTAWVKSQPNLHFVFSSWGLYRPVFTLSGGAASCREYYYPLLAPALSDAEQLELERLLKRKNSVFVFSRVTAEYAMAQQRLFDHARRIDLEPRLLKRFHSPYGGDVLYEAYSLQAPESLEWQPLPSAQPVLVNIDMERLSLDRAPTETGVALILRGVTGPGRGLHVFGIELPLAAPAKYFRFRLSSRCWSRFHDLNIQVLGPGGDPVASFTRPFQWLPMVTEEIPVEIGLNLYPDHFVYTEHKPFAPTGLRIYAGLKDAAVPVELAVSGLEGAEQQESKARQPGGGEL